MDYDLTKFTVSTANLVFSSNNEIPVDFDFTLPDYCPDIGRILKCKVIPHITSREISGDRLVVEGVIQTQLFYLDQERNSLRCYKTETPLSHTFNLKTSPQIAVSLLDYKIEYINCRAVSPRRIDIHGAFSLKANIYEKKNFDLTSEISGEDAEQKTKNITISDLKALAQQPVTISEVLDLGSEKAPAEVLVRSDANVKIEEYEYSSDKLNIKGEINVRLLYQSDVETGKLETVNYEIPLNQTIEAPGASNGSPCIVRAEITSHNEKISEENSDSNSNLINIEVKLIFTVFAFEEREEKVVTDAYSTDYELQTSSESANFMRFFGSKNDSFVCKETIEFPENKILKVIDIWNDRSKVNLELQNEELFYVGTITMSILAVDVDSIPFYAEREVEFTKKAPEGLELNNSSPESSLTLDSINFKISGDNRLDLKFEININTDFIGKNKINFITEVSADETKPKNKETDTALTVYYADSGESIWEIAKRYNTTVNKIKDENEIDFDILENERAILIPMN
ncbi:MAG: DUF3794 domain-containing protein [Oscillospiraceae bacterium]|jgi:LysM repeat protein|nr:DUF3794 domain-containing protein [Oscillospiraceae bacterium]